MSFNSGRQRGVGGEQQVHDCPFCELILAPKREVVAEDDSFIAVFDKFPVNEGHALIIPKRHISSIFEMLREEATDLVDFLCIAKSILDERFSPDGYNVGINCGEAAGQTIPHLHIHLIPRYQGDVQDSRGGIRNFKAPLIAY